MGDDKVRELREALYQAAKANTERRFHALYDKAGRTDVLAEAWAQVRANAGAAGVDGKTIEDIEREGVPSLLEGLARELRQRTYRPSPLLRVEIPKPNGNVRRLGIPTVRDRVVQTAAKLVLEPIFEADFEPFSYGFRPGRSAHDAVDEVSHCLNRGCEQVLEVDIQGCFDSFPKGPLMDAVARRVVDGAMLKLIRQWLDCGVMEGETLRNPERGTPQGAPLSPLLANVYLDRLDKAWKGAGFEKWRGMDARLVRYADDCVIVCRYGVEKVRPWLDATMAELGLTLSAEKTRMVVAEDGFDFLGFHFRRRYDPRRGKRVTRWYPSAKSEGHIRERVRELTETRTLATGTPFTARDALVKVLRGWAEYAQRSMAWETFQGVWWYATRRLNALYRRAGNRPGLARNRDLVRVGLGLPRWPTPIPYGAWRTTA